MKCKYCGAPLDLSIDTCVYCRNKITFDNKFSKKERKIRIFLAFFVFIIGIASIITLISLYFSPNQKLKLAVSNFKYLENVKININTSITNSDNSTRNVNSTILYTNINDTINLNINIKSSKYNNNIELYSIIDSNETSTYIKSSNIDIFGKTKSENDIWLVNVSSPLKISLFDNLDNYSYKYKENNNKKFEHTLSNVELDQLKIDIKNLGLSNFKLLDEELDIDNINKLTVGIFVNNSNEISGLEFIINTKDNKKINIKVQIYKSNDNVSVPVEALSTIDKLGDYIETNKM